jgi:hypothetical protein
MVRGSHWAWDVIAVDFRDLVEEATQSFDQRFWLIALDGVAGAFDREPAPA